MFRGLGQGSRGLGGIKLRRLGVMGYGFKGFMGFGVRDLGFSTDEGNLAPVSIPNIL